MLDLNDAKPLGGEPLRYDLDLVVARLRETAETWVPRLFPRGRKSGDEWRLANIRGDAPRNSGSCVITLRGAHAGDWIDFDGNQGGGPISAIEEATGLDGRTLIIEAADMAGIAPGAPERRAPPTPPPAKRDPALEIAHILTGAKPISGSPVARYLTGRGLTVPPAADLLFHPDLTHWETKTGYPAMLGQVRDRDGAVIGLHRSYLAIDGAAVTKAPLDKAKKMLGRVAGGAVRLAALGDGERLALSEGIETGLAVMTACLDLPVWATLSKFSGSFSGQNVCWGAQRDAFPVTPRNQAISFRFARRAHETKPLNPPHTPLKRNGVPGAFRFTGLRLALGPA